MNTDNNAVLSNRVEEIQARQRARYNQILEKREESRLKRLETSKKLAELKAKDVGVSVIHWRLVSQPVVTNKKEVVFVSIPLPIFEIRRLNLNNALLSNGGYTTVRLFSKDKSVTAEARCHDKDVFNKHLALEIALNRAIEQFNK